MSAPPPPSPPGDPFYSSKAPMPRIVVTGVDGEASAPPPPAYTAHLYPPIPPTQAATGVGMVRYDTMTSYCTNSDQPTPAILPTVVNPSRLDESFLVRCPFCQAQVATRTVGRTGLLTWLMCGLCVFVGCVAGCCLLPFCTRRLKDVEHHCPKCRGVIAIYKRL